MSAIGLAYGCVEDVGGRRLRRGNRGSKLWRFVAVVGWCFVEPPMFGSRRCFGWYIDIDQTAYRCQVQRPQKERQGWRYINPIAATSS
jgi:hypothetical protein